MIVIDQTKKAAKDAAALASTQAASRLSAIKANNRTQAIANALTTKDGAGLIAAVSARYPSLTGDALKAVTDIVLTLGAIYKSP